MTRPSEIREAVKVLEHGRLTHVEWIDYLENENPDFDTEHVGDADHHRWYLSGYEPAIRELNWVADLLDKLTCPNPDCENGQVLIEQASTGGTATMTCPACGGSGNAIPVEWVEAATKAVDDEIGSEIREHLDHIMRKWPNTIQDIAEAAASVVAAKIKGDTDET